MPYTEYDYLAHYGVKGMKWGVRKSDDRNETPKVKQLDMDPGPVKFLKKHTATGRALSSYSGNKRNVLANTLGGSWKIGAKSSLVNLGKGVLATAVVGAYLKSGRDPRVRQGGIVAGRIVNALGTLYLADQMAGVAIRVGKDVLDFKKKR